MPRKNHPEIVADITDEFELKFRIPKFFYLHLRTIGAGVPVRIEVFKWYKKRTRKQNAYLWAVVYPTIIAYILEKTGQKFSAEDLHERYKRKFLGFERCEIMPDLIKVKSSTETSTVEFSDEFVELICVEWSDNGLFIPPPDPNYKNIG